MTVLRIFRHPALSKSAKNYLLNTVKNSANTANIEDLVTELCFNIEIQQGCSITEDELKQLYWILTTAFQEDKISDKSFLGEGQNIIEIGPRLNFSTAFSTNAVSICSSIGLGQVQRLEASTRYLIKMKDTSRTLTKNEELVIVDLLHDRMTQTRYVEPLTNFSVNVKPDPWYQVEIMTNGKKALEDANDKLGLAMDEWDINYYTNMFVEKLKRNPTSVECFDLAQSNSEHSRHWFFRGKLVIDGQELNQTLFQMIMDTTKTSNFNNVIKFSDNSSAIQGFDVTSILPEISNRCSRFKEEKISRHIIFTAETHNFPTGVAPFSGATTGTGGRIRDVQAAGRGAHVIAGTAGYSFGNLNIHDYNLPWEDSSYEYPNNFARPIEVAIEASNGASDYGNKFGEPVLAGFARSFGMTLPNGERREWIKPIMFSGGIGTIDAHQVVKLPPTTGMEVVKLGGPVYRIGVGGGSASSVQVQGDNKDELDFGAVQRGDAEMEQKLNRVIRACLELQQNPICSIHDQGAGGNGNVLKELVEPVGATIFTKEFHLGDPTINTMELWGAEYQESNALLIKPEDKTILREICEREKCPVCFVGTVTGSKKIILIEGHPGSETQDSNHPVDLELEFVLGKMPQKDFNLQRETPLLRPLQLPDGVAVRLCLERVLRLPSVASKRYLTNKVDRSVTGLVAQQQCVGPLHTPLADVAVIALSYFSKVGGATSIGEQPIKGLVNPAVGARMSVAEAVTNLMFAQITCLEDVKCSGNWMWAAKLPGEGAALYDACKAMTEVMSELGIAVDGGKDSLSMAARIGKDTVKSPGTLVISAYAPCTDITQTITPDLKCPDGKGTLIFVDFGKGQSRLGGSALAQCFNQIGDEPADLNNPKALYNAFKITQNLIRSGKIYSGHDVSDGGLVTCILEMAFAGNCGINVNIEKSGNPINVLFAEEVGFVLEVRTEDADLIGKAYRNVDFDCYIIGTSGPIGCQEQIKLAVNNEVVLEDSVANLFSVWEETSVMLEYRQATSECVAEEFSLIHKRKSPPYHLTFDPNISPPLGIVGNDKRKFTGHVPRVAVVREEGTNGDREMITAFHMAGFEVWDVTMQDLVNEIVTLDYFRGLVFPGGFSYADVLGSAKGWAAAMRFNKKLYTQLEDFKERPNTFSLGVCNGCQLMGILGWVAPDAVDKENYQQGVSLSPNISGRYESRFTTVRIEKSPSIMLTGMDGSILGIWVAHGEGRFEFKSESIHAKITSENLEVLHYVNDDGNPTEVYPLNPNGSPGGLAGLCSQDGRHLAMMPHPERGVLTWQWPWMPLEWKSTCKTSPWLRMFENAFNWCTENES